MSSKNMDRRDFIKTLSVGAAVLGFGRWGARLSLAQTTHPASAPQYRFILLGDTHVDQLDHHDMDWVNKTHPKDISQIRNYSEITRLYTPALLKAVKQVIETSTVPVAFVAHAGDLVEGLCGSYELAARQFRDAFNLIEQAQLGVPLLMCKGNHDITGPGAPEAYEKVLLPWMSQQAKTDITAAAFSRRQGDDLYIFFDCYKPDLDWLEAQLRAHADARHTFFMVHQPIVPYNARASWIVYAKPEMASQRQRLLQLLAQRKAIVLSGHLHKYSVLNRRVAGGSFTQLAVCSVVRQSHEQPRDERLGLDAYTPDLLTLEPKFDPGSQSARRQLLLDERPNIGRFEYADVAGFAVVDVSASDVSCQIYAGTDLTPYRQPALV